MASRTGCYICQGCDIGRAVDVEALLRVASERDLPAVGTAGAYCLEDRARIEEDIARHGLDSVVVAACSPRVNRETFRFTQPSGDPVHVQRVNLREQVAWSQPAGAASTQEMAEDLLRMGVAAARNARPAAPQPSARGRAVLVVGGGPAGLSAAVSAADVGHPVVLVEQSETLGGFARRLHRQYPKRPPYTEPEPVDVDAWVAEVRARPEITVLTSSRVRAVAGQPGDFRAEIATGGDVRTFDVGAVVLATGFRLAGPEQLGRYGLGLLPGVVASDFLEEAARAGSIARPADGAPVGSAAILACDGEGAGAHLPHSDSVTAMVALKQALYLRSLAPDARVYVVFQDMQAAGLGELFYRHVQEAGGVTFVRGDVASVSEGEGGRVRIAVNNTVLAREVRIEVDVAVLSAGMIPAATDEGGESPLGLRYRQGAGMPTGRFGHVDSNFLCFPYETRRTGIYAAGAVHRAQDIAQSMRDGAAAALKAVQAMGMASRGAAVHPRVGDLGHPEFFIQNCTSCARCTEECPFGALELDAANHPAVNPARCRRCGVCVGACPVQIISFPEYSVAMVADMVRQVSLPEDDEERLRVLVFACENDACPALDAVGAARRSYPPELRVVPVRCLGSVNAVMVTDAISRGFDGVALLGCRSGVDYQCHFIQGSELLGRRVANVRETLDRMALEPERVQVLETTIGDAHRLPEMLASFVESVKAVGPNPMKGL